MANKKEKLLLEIDNESPSQKNLIDSYKELDQKIEDTIKKISTKKRKKKSN